MTTTPPIITGDELAAWLKGTPDLTLCELCASAASDAVAAVIDPPPSPLPDGWVWADGARLAGLGVGGGAYKHLTAPGGGYQLDEVTYTDVFAVTSVALRKYSAFLAPLSAVGTMIG